MNRYGVPKARAHHGNAEIHLHTNFPLWFASLRSEEVLIKKSARGNFFHGCHGNAEIHMRTKFHFHALHGLQV